MSKNGKLIFKNYDPYITSPFGYRIHPMSGKNQFHQGVDYGTNDKKLAQYAIEDGEVTGCGTDSTGAKYVYVKYPRLGKTGLHYHLDSISVKNGQKVNSNTIIGYTGATGQATGIHLHFGWFPTENRNKAWDDKGWEDFEKYEYKAAETTTTSELKYKIGDTVEIDCVYISSDSTDKIVPAITKGKITRIIEGAKNPYLLDDGNIGWINDDCVVSGSVTTYIVKSGDTLSGIAEKYGTTWQKIYEKNKDIIGSDPDLIKPGQVLKF